MGAPFKTRPFYHTSIPATFRRRSTPMPSRIWKRFEISPGTRVIGAAVRQDLLAIAHQEPDPSRPLDDLGRERGAGMRRHGPSEPSFRVPTNGGWVNTLDKPYGFARCIRAIGYLDAVFVGTRWTRFRPTMLEAFWCASPGCCARHSTSPVSCSGGKSKRSHASPASLTARSMMGCAM